MLLGDVPLAFALEKISPFLASAPVQPSGGGSSGGGGSGGGRVSFTSRVNHLRHVAALLDITAGALAPPQLLRPALSPDADVEAKAERKPRRSYREGYAAVRDINIAGTWFCAAE